MSAASLELVQAFCGREALATSHCRLPVQVQGLASTPRHRACPSPLCLQSASASSASWAPSWAAPTCSVAACASSSAAGLPWALCTASAAHSTWTRREGASRDGTLRAPVQTVRRLNTIFLMLLPGTRYCCGTQMLILIAGVADARFAVWRQSNGCSALSGSSPGRPSAGARFVGLFATAQAQLASLRSTCGCPPNQ